VTGVVVVQFLSAALFMGTCIVLVVLIRQAELKHGPDRASTVQGLKLALGILAPLATVVLVGAWGLAKNRPWGWWLAFLIDVGLLGILLYSMVDDGLDNIDWDMFQFPVVAFVLVAWLLAPAVRCFYWADTEGGSGEGLDANVLRTKP
jgi:hypothetical protein